MVKKESKDIYFNSWKYVLVIILKFILLIFVVLTTLMVYSAVAGPSDNAAPYIEMDLTEEKCRLCHGDNVKPVHHSGNQADCDRCHSELRPIIMNKTCGLGGDCHNTLSSVSNDELKFVTDHHNFTAIFSNEDWTCLTCHEKGVPRKFN